MHESPIIADEIYISVSLESGGKKKKCFKHLTCQNSTVSPADSCLCENIPLRSEREPVKFILSLFMLPFYVSTYRTVHGNMHQRIHAYLKKILATVTSALYLFRPSVALPPFTPRKRRTTASGGRA